MFGGICFKTLVSIIIKVDGEPKLDKSLQLTQQAPNRLGGSMRQLLQNTSAINKLSSGYAATPMSHAGNEKGITSP
jgi:hypothetical protein